MPQCIFKVQQALTRKYDIEQPMYFEVGDDGLPVVSGEPSDEGRDSQRQERLPPLNQAYRVYDETGKGSFDVPRLFNDALQGECEVQAQVYRERVMQLSGIAIPFKYNQLLNEALKQKVIIKVQRDKLTYYQAAPF